VTQLVEQMTNFVMIGFNPWLWYHVKEWIQSR